MAPPVQVVLHLAAAIVAGGLVGMERTYHGRAAGFRTHVLVCLASSFLMLLPLYPQAWGGDAQHIDPTRMAQGIMTGIGFLGAGAIMRDGLSVRGLTTAASIWATAALGILIGVGLWVPAALGTAAMLVALTALRRLELVVPVHHYADFKLRFPRLDAPPLEKVRALLSAEGLEAFDFTYRLVEGGTLIEYAGTMSTRSVDHFAQLALRLRDAPDVHEFAIEPY